jgi:tRNA G18 (ribose-2'-O)-methylase SpoU
LTAPPFSGGWLIVANVISIDDPDDPRVAPYRDIRERDLVGRQGWFVAEGEVVLNVLMSGRSLHRPLSLLIAEKRVRELPWQLTDDVPVYVVSQNVMDGIAGFHIHRGMLALGRRTPMQDAAALLSGLGRRAIVVVLAGIANHDNMGGICRNAAAFGVDAVLLDNTCVDPFYRKAIRVSVGGVLTLRFAKVANADAALDLCAVLGFDVIALSPSGGMELSALQPAGRIAAFFGAEGPGLPDSVLRRSNTVRIAMKGPMDSLNVATASGIVLHHLSRR